VLAGAGRGFRRHGYGGAGVDALAREAGVTSGAFYGHFRSKSEAFRASLVAGLEDLRGGIEHLRGERGADWLEELVDFYVGERRTCDVGESCALQVLTVDAARADDTTRAAFEAEWLRIRDAAAAGLAGEDEARRAQATAILALLSGGVSIARAVRRPAVSEAIADAVRGAALALGAPTEPGGKGKKKRRKGDRDETAAGPATAGVPPGARPPLPPFTAEAATEKARLAEDAWNSRDATRVSLACHEDAVWRNRAEFARGRAEIAALLARKWTRELDYRVIQEVWAHGDDRLAVRTASEWRDDSGHWFRSHGNEQWQFDARGLLTRREASINDVLIREVDRLLRWPLGPRPVDHPGLTDLGL
jgi:nuclear transport factor 2 (NTF2) superfamily protein/AcrR family transcriptional regulator